MGVWRLFPSVRTLLLASQSSCLNSLLNTLVDDKMSFTIALSGWNWAHSILNFQSGSRAVLRVAPSRVSSLLQLWCNFLVYEDVILQFLNLIHKIVVSRSTIGLSFESFLDLLTFEQAVDNSLKALLTLNHGLHNYFLVFPMILRDVALEWLCTTAWDLYLDLVVLFISRLSNLVVQVHFWGTDQVLLSANVDYWNSHIIFLQ